MLQPARVHTVLVSLVTAGQCEDDASSAFLLPLFPSLFSAGGWRHVIHCSKKFISICKQASALLPSRDFTTGSDPPTLAPNTASNRAKKNRSRRFACSGLPVGSGLAQAFITHNAGTLTLTLTLMLMLMLILLMSCWFSGIILQR